MKIGKTCLKSSLQIETTYNFQTGKSSPAVTIHRLLAFFSSNGILARLNINVLRFLNYISKGRRLSFTAQDLI